ncbi:MAG TPA: hypothetical protein VKA46_22760 [Gemmataceae bacterium]|nr:hypothetical protein [Gemmataceae bacterium]
MPLPFAEFNLLEGLVPALWAGVFQLAALAVVGLWVNFVYQRYRALAAARQELIDEIDRFAISLYKPRKLYLAMLAESPALLSAIPDAVQRQGHRAALMEQCLAELIDAIGRLRSLQVKMVPLYGYHVELFGHYLATWRYLKEVRHLMEHGQSLYFHPEDAEGADAFYKLIDTFRYRIMMQKLKRHPPQPIQPPDDLLRQMRQSADVIYDQHFGAPAPPNPCGPE